MQSLVSDGNVAWLKSYCMNSKLSL